MKTSIILGKKMLSILLTLLMVISLVSMSVCPTFAADVSTLTTTIDTGAEITISDSDGDGYYEIGNADELYAFLALVNSGNTAINAVLTADITINTNVLDENGDLIKNDNYRTWAPIGNGSNQYIGTFNGNGYTVSGLYYSEFSTRYIGLFGYLGSGGTVENTGVIDSYFLGEDNIGSIVGKSEGTVKNCYNASKVRATHAYVGGIVGNNVGVVTNCYNSGIVDAYDNVGGIAGLNSGTVENCYSTGTIIGFGYRGAVVSYNTGIVTNCYYLDASYLYGIYYKEDIIGSYEAKTYEQFASGEVACLLGDAFGQTIGTDNYPTLGGDKVYYGYISCADDATEIYTNDSSVSTEKLGHNWVGGACTVCEKVCEHDWDSDTGVCNICMLECTHEGEMKAEYDWYEPYDGECYVDVEFCCAKCGYIDYDWGYAAISETVEGEDCMNPGYEAYSVTFEYNGEEYTDIKKFILRTYNHTGECVNGFCSDCGGYEMPELVEGGEYGEYYAIENAGQLYCFADYINNENNEAHAMLVSDIVINESLDAANLREWTPIGSDSLSGFYGSFDGQGHTISGLYCNTETSYVGLLGYAHGYYPIKNVGIINSYFKGADHVGALAGYAENEISNCYVANTTVEGNYYTGAIVGYNIGSIENCYTYTDNFVGYSYYGEVEKCYYLADSETDSLDGTTYKTTEQFKSGEVACLLQAGVTGEEVWDEELQDYVTSDPKEIWGQALGEDAYPALGGATVYFVENCIGESVYSNINKNGQHNFVDDVCTECGEITNRLAGYSISLGDKIAVNYYMILNSETLADENAKMVFSVPDTGSYYNVEISVSDAVANGEHYVFTCEVAAKEMTSAIKAKFVTSDSELQLKDYTVQEYAEKLLEAGVMDGSTTPDEAVMEQYFKTAPVVMAMLNYGTQAQIYFNYNTDNLANDTKYMTKADKAITTYDFKEFASTVSGEEAGVTYYGTSLSLETETAIKHYFVIEDQGGLPEFKVNGETVNAVKNGDFYEVKITDLPAHNLDEMFVIEAGSLKIEYGVFSYAYQASLTDKEELKNVVNALYTFNQAAITYLSLI